MAYNAHKRNVIGTLGFFCLGVLINGIAPIIAILREYSQYNKNGVLEHDDIKRYVVSSSIGVLVNTILISIIF